MEGGAGVAPGSRVDRRARHVAANDHSRAAPGRESLVDSRHLPGVHRLREAAGGARPRSNRCAGISSSWTRHMARRPGPAGSRQSMRSAAGPRRWSCCPPRRILGTRTSSMPSARIGSGAGHSPLVCFRRTRADVDVAQSPVRSRVFTVPPTEDERQMHRQLERYTSLLWASARRGEANPALLATVFRKRALSSAGALAVSLVRRLASMASLPQVETQPWLPLGSDDIRRGGRRGRRQRDRRKGPRTIPSASGRLSSSVSMPPRPHPPPKAKQRYSSVSFPGSTPPPSCFPSTAIRRCGCALALLHMGRQVVLLHGGLTPDERAQQQRSFCEGER